MLIFTPHVVQTFPEPATHSDLMYIFVKGYLGKKYGVQSTFAMSYALRKLCRSTTWSLCGLFLPDSNALFK